MYEKSIDHRGIEHGEWKMEGKKKGEKKKEKKVVRKEAIFHKARQRNALACRIRYIPSDKTKRKTMKYIFS